MTDDLTPAEDKKLFNQFLKSGFMIGFGVLLIVFLMIILLTEQQKRIDTSGVTIKTNIKNETTIISPDSYSLQ